MYNKKGPCYCWELEIAWEKEITKKKAEKLNEELEPLMKREWEF